MSNEEYYIIENEITDTTKKKEYWNAGIGLNKVDNLEPSKYLLDLSEKHIMKHKILTILAFKKKKNVI